jgi:ACT domain-containing protein
MNEVRKLLPIKKDYQIMKILGIPNSTFYRYKSKIYKEHKELWSKVMIETFESRPLKIYQNLEESCRINRQIALNENAKPMDRIEASKGMVNAQYNILKLL